MPPIPDADRGWSVETLPDGAVFRIERAAKLNALTKPVLEGLAATLDALEARRARLLVVTGAGERAFCAGTDLQEARAMDAGAVVAKSAMARALFVRLARSPVIAVAAINGLAFGGGLELAMGCVLRIAAPHATLSLPEIRLGLLPAYAGTQMLPAIVGPSRALELMLTGRTVALDEALAIGLVHRAARMDSPLVEQAIAFGREVVRWSPDAIAAIRRCVDAAGPVVGDAGLAAEDAAVRAVFDGPDAREGVAAFLEKREPRFGGR